MGDSDDEYGRRRGRDKFMKERNDFQPEKRRDFVSGGDRRGNTMNRDFRQPPMRSNRPDSSPPMKRLRKDWDDSYDPTVRREVEPAPPSTPVASTSGAPTLMSFKQFLTSQDDSISDEEAIQKYHDYKLEFKRQQLHAFFIAHKDEEWFRLKYHPEDSAKRKVEQLAAVQRRLTVFQELSEKWLEKCNLDHDNTRNLIKFMDAVVIKLEGGTDDDIAALDRLEELLDDSYDEPNRRQEDDENRLVRKKEPENEEKAHENNDVSRKKKVGTEDGAISDSEASDKGSVASGKSKSTAPASVGAAEPVAEVEKALGDKENSVEPHQDDTEPVVEENGEVEHSAKVNGEVKPAKRGKSRASDEADDSSADEEEEPAPKKEKSPELAHIISTSSAVKTTAQPSRMMLHKTSSIFLRNLAPTITKSEVEALCKRFPGFLRVSLAEPIADRKYYRRGWVTFKREVNIKDICWNLNSIRLKDCDMLPIVNRDLTRRVRVANGILSHRQVAQNDLRLAARLVQLYDKKYSLWQDDISSGPEKKQQPGQDICTSGEFNLTSKNPLLKNITDYLIEEASAEEEELLGTYASNSNENSDQKVVFERNDDILKVLDRILLYLRVIHSIDYYNHGEYPAEDEMPNRCGLIHARGPPIPPSQYGTDDSGNTLVSTAFVNDFCKNFENHLQPLLTPKDQMSEEEAGKLGRKDADKEVEAFINANCQELAKDKWLCPLSGKKFKGPDFVRKHILMKHAEKLDEVKSEVLYFNNYLLDSKRPAPPEAKPQTFVSQQPTYTPQQTGAGYTNNTPSSYGNTGNYDRGSRDDQPRQQDYYGGGSGGSGGGRGYSGGGQGGGGGGYYNRNQNDFGGGGGGGGYNRRDHYQRRDFAGGSQGGGGGGGYGSMRGNSRHYQATPSDTRRDPRVPVTYTDLDAPEDVY